MLVLQLLKSIPFFDSLSEDDHLDIIENIRLNYFPEGHIIFKEGDPGDIMYIIRSGKVKIFQSQGDHERTITVLSANEFFGEMSLISDKPRNAGVKALEECEVFS
ncbi:cyclic nucleotide-binding domain-containing protein, partial [Candidatus Peregrinibacteria bacterium]|nr:cyclic nucleotide-binding domain-containing protein [Candidatus Peregrinibacteria bacterium]